MPKTAPKSSAFMNSKRRVIMVGPSGGTFVKTKSGKSYNPVAKFMKTNSGSVRAVTPSNAPRMYGAKAAKTKDTRKPRKNKGILRGVQSAEKKAVKMLEKFNYPDKVFNMVFKKPRKTRKNKGAKRASVARRGFF
tara:strand:- start:74 stop:478 length:405 start_codon:yes stop_codon:yes gene_type:complete